MRAGVAVSSTQITGLLREQDIMLAIILPQQSRPGGVPIDDPLNIVLVWCLVIIFNVVVAAGKNRSAPAWFFLSVLLGPIATLLILLSERLPKSEEG